MKSTVVRNPEILFIASEFPPCGGGGVRRIHGIARHLADAGNRVTVLTASKNNFAVMNTSYSTDVPGLTIEPVYSPYLKNTLRRISKYLPFVPLQDHYILWARLAVRRFRSLHAKHHFDLVISSYPSYWNHWVGRQVSKRAGLPWIADFRDPPEWMYANRVPSKPVSAEFFTSPAALVTTTENARQLFLRNFPSLDSGIIEVIENGCDELASQIVRKAHNPAFTITHTGSFYENGRDINQLISALKLLDANIHLQFIGDDPYPATRALLSRESLDDKVRFLPFLPSNDALQAAADSDALVVIQGKLFENQIPGKTYEYLAMQKPLLVITNQGSATWHTVVNEPNVVIAEYGNQESIRNALCKILNHVIVPVDRYKFSNSFMSEKFKDLVAQVHSLNADQGTSHYHA